MAKSRRNTKEDRSGTLSSEKDVVKVEEKKPLEVKPKKVNNGNSKYGAGKTFEPATL